MGLLGALFGGSVGFMIGGPLGALLGGALGSRLGDGPRNFSGTGPQSRMVGRCPRCNKLFAFSATSSLACPHCGASLSQGGSGAAGGFGANGYSSATDQASAQSAFMVALISLAAKVAKADGKVTKAEIVSFDNFLRNNLNLPDEDRRIAAQIFNRARDSQTPASEYAHQIRSIMQHQPDRLRDLISLLLMIAYADGSFSSEEEQLIRSIASDLGLSPRAYDEAQAMFSRGNVDAAYAVLGVQSTASDTEVKKAYRRLAKEYHPDVLASKGMSEDFNEFAREKMRAVNNAYDQVKEARGI